MVNVFKILDFLGYGSTIIVIIAVIVSIYRWCSGISPALFRLGKGLASRRIAVFAENDNFNSLKNLLVDSKLFKEKNVTQVTRSELKKAEDFSLFLAHWKSNSSHLDAILSEKKDGTALLIYAPQEEGFIPQNEVAKINQHRNVIVVNFRGRLLNDIMISLITTSYEK